MENIISKRIHDFTKQVDIIQTVLVFLIALVVPTFLGQIIQKVFGVTSVIASNSQLIVGSIVNAALIVTAINLKGWKILGVVTMPSISTIFGGYVFGTSSTYLTWMIPAIWIGNFILVFSFKYFMINKEKNYFLAAVIGIVLKVLVIAGGFQILRAFGIFPDKLITNLQTAMSTTQLITACIGTVIAFVIYKIEDVSINKKALSK